MSVNVTEVVKEIVPQLPIIISESSKSDLGILSLSIILIAFIAYLFFKEATERTKIFVFLCLFGGLVTYGITIKRNIPPIGSKLPDTKLTVPKSTADNYQSMTTDVPEK